MVNTPEKPKACIIWLHGIGGDGTNIAMLAEQLLIPPVIKNVFLSAPFRNVTINNGMRMRAWYDIFGDEINDHEDDRGIHESHQQILTALDEQLVAGFKTEQIFLAGFSQGGAMAQYTALHQTHKLAGVIALSSYLPLRKKLCPLLPKDVPFFIAAGKFDPLILSSWTRESFEIINSFGYIHTEWHEYPMEHAVCLEEIQHLSLWISTHLQGIPK